MTFQRYSSDRTFIKWKDYEPGDTVAEGTFLSDSVSEKYGSREFEVRQEDGSILVVPAIHSLTQLVDKHVSLGDYVRISLTKTMELTQGRGKGKLYRITAVDIDPSRFEAVKGSVEREVAAPPSTDEDKTPDSPKSPEGVVL